MADALKTKQYWLHIWVTKERDVFHKEFKGRVTLAEIECPQDLLAEIHNGFWGEVEVSTSQQRKQLLDQVNKMPAKLLSEEGWFYRMRDQFTRLCGEVEKLQADQR